MTSSEGHVNYYTQNVFSEIMALVAVDNYCLQLLSYDSD